jgi:hypothetical protein
MTERAKEPSHATVPLLLCLWQATVLWQRGVPAQMVKFWAVVNRLCANPKTATTEAVRHERDISNAGRWKLDFAEIDQCKPVLLGLSLAGYLVKPLLSLYWTEWRELGYGLCIWLHLSAKVLLTRVQEGSMRGSLGLKNTAQKSTPRPSEVASLASPWVGYQ